MPGISYFHFSPPTLFYMALHLHTLPNHGECVFFFYKELFLQVKTIDLVSSVSSFFVSVSYNFNVSIFFQKNHQVTGKKKLCVRVAVVGDRVSLLSRSTRISVCCY